MIKPGHVVKPRSVGAVVLAAVLAILISQVTASGSALVSTAGSPAAARLTSAQSVSSRAVLAPDVIVVTRAIVAANLVSVSTDGNTYVFKRAAGGLRHLKVGKVMLLQGYSVGVVSSLKKAKKTLTVTTTPASMTEIFKTADIDYSQHINFRKTFASLAAGTRDSAPARQGDSLGQDVTAAPAARPPDPKVGLSFTGTGPGDFTYGIAVTPSPAKLDWSITGCVGGSFLPSKGTCTKGGSGLAVDATLSGFISKAKVSGEFDIANGKDVHSSYTFLSLGGVKFVYEVLRGDTSAKKFTLPVLRIPITFDVPFTVLGVPMLLKVEFALLAKLYITSKQAIVNGGVKFTYGGSEGVTESGSSDSAAPNSESVKGKFITGKDSPTAESAALEFATQMKVGIGPGLSVANILGYADVITALGQETGTDVAGLPCSKFYLDVSGHAYLEAQIASLKVSSTPQTLFDKKASDTKAEC